MSKKKRRPGREREGERERPYPQQSWKITEKEGRKAVLEPVFGSTSMMFAGATRTSNDIVFEGVTSDYYI